MSRRTRRRRSERPDGNASLDRRNRQVEPATNCDARPYRRQPPSLVASRRPPGVCFQGRRRSTRPADLVAFGQGRTAEAPGGIVDYRWSPDGVEIAFTSPGEVVAKRDPIEVDRTFGRNRLWIVRAWDGKTQAVTKPDRHVVEMAWSPGGDEFAATVAPSDDLNDVFENARLVVIDRATGEVKRTLSERVLKWCDKHLKDN